MANRGWAIGIILAVAIASVGLYLFLRDPYSESEIRQLIDTAYTSRRPGTGRLSGAVYAPPSREAPNPPEDLSTAQVLLLHFPGSPARQELQGRIYLAAGDWQKFVELVNDLPAGTSKDHTIINNLGASFLALSDKDPSMLLKAREAFERANKMEPKAPEPLFNLVVTYRKLRFAKAAAETLRQYSQVDADSSWYEEIANPEQRNEAAILDRLERAVASNDLDEAARLFQANSELCRRSAMQFALSEESNSAALVRFIAGRMERDYGDKTVSAMLAPLFTDDREVVIEVRRHVNRGAESFADRKYPESMAAYLEAANAPLKSDLVFDRLWIDLNKVDTQIKLGRFDEARETLSRIISVADQHQFLWIKAKARSLYGSTLRLTSSYTELLDTLAKAEQDFIHLKASRDQIRVLYYLAAYRHYGGDQDEALRLAMECLLLVDENDAIRLSTVDWLIGSILTRLGMQADSLLFARESVEQSQQAQDAPGAEFQASLSLAELYQSLAQDELGDTYLKLAEDAFHKIPEGFDHIRSELMVDLVKAKARINEKNYREAEALLLKDLDLYSKQPFSATPLLAQSLRLLAQVYSETGRTKEAGLKFIEAIDVVEKDDDYMKSESYRVKFDSERRELYDSAIQFEFRNGSLDAAWTYLQKYRAKLFLEFLAAFNPAMKPTRTGLNQAGIQQRIPKDTQIVEYALLKDQLLIWVVTDTLFTVRSIPAARTEVEAKVQETLKRLRMEDEVDPLLSDLGQLLVAPIANLLDPHRSLTIIPDRALHGLPFGALKQPGKAGYLTQEFPIVVSPSLTHFLTSNGRQPLRGTIVGYGSQSGSASEFKELAALTGIYPEAATFTGQQVDKTSFLAGLKTAPVFHYAGHSVTDAVDPLRSSILLDGNRLGPNSVTAIDISQQRLQNNAVVILSSCDSSVGNSRDGIGVRGLTSAFLIAGAGSVVGSLWPVESSSTAELMIRFHRAFASGMPVAKALREAQLDFLKAFPERSHPYYWSGFVVSGNFSALR